MNVPPVDRSPGSLALSQRERAVEAAWIARFNFRLGALAWSLVGRHSDATVFQFNTHALFSRVLENPAQFPETAGYRNTTGYCQAYNEWMLPDNTTNPGIQAELTKFDGTSTMAYTMPFCGIPLDAYFWLNSLHPTCPMHNFMASQIVQLLKS